MESQLTTKLLALQLKDEPEVTRNSLSDCLFQCFAQSVKLQSEDPRNFETVGDTKLVPYFSHTLTKEPAEREKVDVSTPTGIRLLVADAAKCWLDPETPHARTEELKKHILHRYRSANMRARDAEVLGDDVLPDDAPENDKFEQWCRIMQSTGVN